MPLKNNHPYDNLNITFTPHVIILTTPEWGVYLDYELNKREMWWAKSVPLSEDEQAEIVAKLQAYVARYVNVAKRRLEAVEEFIVTAQRDIAEIKQLLAFYQEQLDKRERGLQKVYEIKGQLYDANDDSHNGVS